MAISYDNPRPKLSEIQGDNRPVKDSMEPKNGAEGMINTLSARGTPRSALETGFVRTDMGDAAKSNKPGFL